MKKFVQNLLLLVLLCASTLSFVACENSTPPPENLELSTVKLTTENISTYLACNVEYSEYTIQTVEDKTLYTFKATITTSPRLPNLSFEEVSIRYGDSLWGVLFESSSPVWAQLDYQGYSSVSTYFYTFEDTATFNQHDLPLISPPFSHISAITGNVLVSTEIE